MSKKHNKANVATLEVETVEFTNKGTDYVEGVTTNVPPLRDDSTPVGTLEGLGQALEAMIVLEGQIMPRNPVDVRGRNDALFLSAGDAIQAFKNIRDNTKDTLQFMRRAVREALVIYGMHAEAEKRNLQPLTHAVYALNRKDMFGHKRRDLAANLIAWVEGCSNARWRKDKKTGIERFVQKKDTQMNVSFSDEGRRIFDTDFDLYSKPVVKKAFDFNSSLKRLLEKAEREGVNQDERAKIVALFNTGNAPETVVIPGNSEEAQNIQAQRPALRVQVDTQANEAEAA